MNFFFKIRVRLIYDVPENKSGKNESVKFSKI